MPFADDLEVIHRSQPLPVSVLCSVGDRVAAGRLTEAMKSLESLDDRADAAEALAGVRLASFEELDPAALERAEQLFDGVDE